MDKRGRSKGENFSQISFPFKTPIVSFTGKNTYISVVIDFSEMKTIQKTVVYHFKFL